MTTNATAAPARTAARRYSESMSLLVDRQTRAYMLGLAVVAAEQGGYALPREAEQVRDLLDEAIAERYRQDPDAYARAVKAGEAEMAARAARVGAPAA